MICVPERLGALSEGVWKVVLSVEALPPRALKGVFEQIFAALTDDPGCPSAGAVWYDGQDASGGTC